ncbi:hypothetical protein PGT21_019189 [Puccinia graminis f. sp. tritici]|uniref:Uncharacterized protein n=1 Tax=Puccinia graminis f. sp. tritici TaxID=56615 RepID=A0A5B0P8A4_PUCGR|nr:hypothetical protein PGT21_019189 [Puccinia graminis f. sp. tritici]
MGDGLERMVEWEHRAAHFTQGISSLIDSAFGGLHGLPTFSQEEELVLVLSRPSQMASCKRKYVLGKLSGSSGSVLPTLASSLPTKAQLTAVTSRMSPAYFHLWGKIRPKSACLPAMSMCRSRHLIRALLSDEFTIASTIPLYSSLLVFDRVQGKLCCCLLGLFPLRVSPWLCFSPFSAVPARLYQPTS